MTTLTSFPLFPALVPEIRDQIWALTLPPARVMHVLPSTKSPRFSFKTEYTTSPASYGANHPVILSVCKESRGVALRHLTQRFNCYWNLQIDTLYIEVKRWGEDDAMRMLADLRKRGLLDGFRSLALDSEIWKSSKPEHCMASLRLLPTVSTCAFIFKARNWHKDVIDPGVSWYLLPVNSTEQTEFKTHEEWCPRVRTCENQSKEYIENESVEGKKGWKNRLTRLEITMRVICGRKMEPLPFSTRYYEAPGQDFFG